MRHRYKQGEGRELETAGSGLICLPVEKDPHFHLFCASNLLMRSQAAKRNCVHLACKADLKAVPADE